MSERPEGNPLFTCGNCLNWGRTWRFLKKPRVCSSEKDKSGNLLTVESTACKYFVPIQGSLPVEIQRLRLFVQTLGETEAAYLEWALKQRRVLVDLKDANNDDIALGDFIYFRHGGHAYFGSIEGVDHDNKGAVIVNTPAFDNATISLTSSSVRLLRKDELNEIVKKALPEENKNTLDWQTSALETEIASLRAKGLDNFTYEDRVRLVFLEGELRAKNALTRYYHSFL